MTKGRLETFSDGVIAIIITVMVLEMKVPHGDDLNSLKPVFPVFLSYILSFINVGIYWNNHHHMMHAVQHVNAKSNVGEYAFAFLAFADTFCFSMDGRKSFYYLAGCIVWHCAVYGRRGILYFSACTYSSPW